MNCPKCDAVMERVAAAGYEVDRCGSCEGLWFDLREHEHLKRQPDAVERVDTGDTDRGRAMDDVRDIDCPRCQTKMVKLAFPDQPHIRYENCSVCGGVFLDAGEFRDFADLSLTERVSRFLAPLRR